MLRLNLKIKNIIVSMVFMCMNYAAFSQVCLDIGRQESAVSLRSLNPKRYGLTLDLNDNIPVVVHLMSKKVDDKISEGRILEVFDIIQGRFPSEMKFHVEEILTLDNETYQSNQDSDDAYLKSISNNHKLNLLIVDEIENSNSNSVTCGTATYPEVNSIHHHVALSLSNSCPSPGAPLRIEGVITHEIGHFFGLPHTHSGWGSSNQEKINQCSTTGDTFCDTPPDPVLFSHKDNIISISSNNNTEVNCFWRAGYGIFEDPDSGQFFIPEVNNAMSYSKSKCQFHFSEEQKETLIKYFNLRVNQQIQHGDIKDAVKVYPNPVQVGGVVKITVDFKNTEGDEIESRVLIYDIFGKQIGAEDKLVSTGEPGKYILNKTFTKSGQYIVHFGLNASSKPILKQIIVH